jgi:hypothetical protein
MNERPFLDRCPFCGGKAELVKISKDYSPVDGAITDAFMVRCSHCSARTNARASNVRIDGDGCIKVNRNGADEAIQLWNNRTKFDAVVYPEERGIDIG